MDIAHQLIHGKIGSKFDVILGGGYREFLSNNTKDPHKRTGRRVDHRDLVREWIYTHERSMFVHDKVNILMHNVLK